MKQTPHYHRLSEAPGVASVADTAEGAKADDPWGQDADNNIKTPFIKEAEQENIPH